MDQDKRKLMNEYTAISKRLHLLATFLTTPVLKTNDDTLQQDIRDRSVKLYWQRATIFNQLNNNL